MADIPTYVAQQSARTGSTGPTANPEEFGAGVGEALAQAGQGLERGARLAGRAVNRMQMDQRVRQQYDDSRWAGQAYEQEKRSVSEFMANPENNQKESFAQDLDNFVAGRLKQYTRDTAPSGRALDMFLQNFTQFSTTSYDHALNRGYSNAINNGVNSVGTQIQDMTVSYHNTRSVSDRFAQQSMMDSVAHISNNIESTFRKIAPSVADGLHKDLTSEAVMATAQSHPELAKLILDNNQHVDEKTRRSLMGIIDDASKSRNIVEQNSFDQSRSDALIRAEAGTGGDKISIDKYKLYYPDDKAQVLKSRDDNYIDAMNKAYSTIKDISPMEESHQLAKLSEMQKGIQTEADMEVFKKVHSEVMQNVKMQEQNPVGWLYKFNPTISSMVKAAKDSPPEQQLGAVRALNDAVLKYQGAAPADATPEEKSRYLNRPLSDRHLLDSDEATQTAADLNVSSPNEFIKKMGDVLARYPDPHQQYVAFNDLATMPSGKNALRQEYQLAWQNKDAWWLDTYLGALKGAKDITVPDADLKTIEQRIDNNPVWLQFRSAMVGDNFSRAHEIAGFREGINQYARALTTQGKGTKEAADSAVGMLISETLGMAKVNGRPLVVLRDQGQGLPRRTDQEVQDLGRRLGLALRFVDPREVNQAPFAALRLFGNDEMHMPRLQALRDSLTARAFFQTGPDGQSASLYYADDNGSIFQIQDRKGQPFNINFKDLPKFEPRAVSSLGGRMVPGMPETFPAGEPAKHYELIQDLRADRMFGHEYQTNWPVHVDWLHAPAKK